MLTSAAHTYIDSRRIIVQLVKARGLGAYDTEQSCLCRWRHTDSYTFVPFRGSSLHGSVYSPQFAWPIHPCGPHARVFYSILSCSYPPPLGQDSTCQLPAAMFDRPSTCPEPSHATSQLGQSSTSTPSKTEILSSISSTARDLRSRLKDHDWAHVHKLATTCTEYVSRALKAPKDQKELYDKAEASAASLADLYEHTIKPQLVLGLSNPDTGGGGTSLAWFDVFKTAEMISKDTRSWKRPTQTSIWDSAIKHGDYGTLDAIENGVITHSDRNHYAKRTRKFAKQCLDDARVTGYGHSHTEHLKSKVEASALDLYRASSSIRSDISGLKLRRLHHSTIAKYVPQIQRFAVELLSQPEESCGTNEKT